MSTLSQIAAENREDAEACMGFARKMVDAAATDRAGRGRLLQREPSVWPVTPDQAA